VNTENPVEVEVKIRVDRLPPWREKLLHLAAVSECPRVFERNLLFDSARQRLKKQGVLLRLRQQEGRNILTMKRPARQDAKYKIREEIEADVSDFAGAQKILLGIGFRVFFVYEKYREVFSLPGARVMLDETPIGNFLEIEGEPAGIDQVASQLGFSSKDYITASYSRLFFLSGGSGDMVFSP
jgi:adenylate cyclase class 2